MKPYAFPENPLFPSLLSAPVTFFVTRSAAMLGGDGLPGPA